MPIAANVIQRRMAEVGRIRMGEKKPASNGRSRPARLDHFRLTSHGRDPIDAVAEVYGGEVTPWDTDLGRQWQVTITADALDVLVAPGETFTQWFELWKGGGCERRCNGITLETFRGKDVRDDEADCLCPRDAAERVELAADGEACKPTSRLSVWLPKVPGLGLWRAETHGFYAAAELPATIGFLQTLYAQGYRIGAIMRIGTRSVKRPGQPTKTFPVLEVDAPTVRLDAVLESGVQLPGEGAPLIMPGELAQIAAPDAKQIGPGAPLAPNESPTGPYPSKRERRPRPGTGTPPALPAESDMRRPASAASQPSTRPGPGVAPTPRAATSEDDEEAEADAMARQEPSMTALPFGTDEPPHPGGEPIATHVAVADTVTGEVVGHVDNGLTPDQFKAMVRSTGMPSADVVALARELFPDESDLRALNDDQRGRLYDAAAERMAAREKEAQA